MKGRTSILRGALWSSLPLAALAIWLSSGEVARTGLSSGPARAQDRPAAAAGMSRATMLYTVNNLGYTDVCG